MRPPRSSSITTITALTPLPSDPGVCSVRVAGRAVARLRAVDVARLELRVGEPWTEERRAEVDAAGARAAARRDGLTRLGRRACTRVEMQDHLTRKGHPRPVVERVVDDLAEEGWLDDLTTARDAARNLVRRQPATAALIVETLRARGIDGAEAERVAEETLEGVDLLEAALALARRRLATARAASPSARARRLATALGRRGFDDDTIATVLERLGLLTDRDDDVG